MIKMSVNLEDYPKSKSTLMFVRGDTIPLELSVHEGNLPKDLVDWTSFILTIDKSSRPKDNFNSYAVSGIVSPVVDPEIPNKVIFDLPVIDDSGNYYFDIQAQTTGGSIITLILGSAKVLQDINLA